MKRTFALIIASFIAVPASAQDISLSEKMALGIPMDEAAFFAMTDGNNITYNNGTADQYREYYRPGTHRIIIEWEEVRDPNQDTCDIGTWYVQDELICFDWFASGKVCSRWVDYKGEYISVIVEDGKNVGSLEVISTISREPMFCEVGMVQLDLLLTPETTG